MIEIYAFLDFGEGKRDYRPFFRCDAILVIPAVCMSPALDDVQQTVNKAAQAIINVSKGISQWSKVSMHSETVVVLIIIACIIYNIAPIINSE